MLPITVNITSQILVGLILKTHRWFSLFAGVVFYKVAENSAVVNQSLRFGEK